MNTYNKMDITLQMYTPPLQDERYFLFGLMMIRMIYSVCTRLCFCYEFFSLVCIVQQQIIMFLMIVFLHKLEVLLFLVLLHFFLFLDRFFLHLFFWLLLQFSKVLNTNTILFTSNTVLFCPSSMNHNDRMNKWREQKKISRTKFCMDNAIFFQTILLLILGLFLIQNHT